MIRGYPIARRNFLLITFNWLANALVYNGLSYYSANLEVSSHLGFFIRKHKYLQVQSINFNKKYVGNFLAFSRILWNWFMSVVQFCSRGSFLLPWLVFYGQMGSTMGSFWNYDAWRIIMHILHICSYW